MDKNARLALLKQFYEEDPHEPFNVYALATEYLSIDPQQALDLFEQLLTQHPHYGATYYHAAALYAQLGDNAKAEQTYQQGIAVLESQQNAKAIKELKGAYQLFLDEQEDW